MSEEYQKILSVFGDRPKEMMNIMNVFVDKESKILLTKLTGPNSPLMADSLPYGKSGGTKLSNLSKLQNLVKLGLAEESEIREGNKTIVRYHSTPKANIIMENLSKSLNP